MRGRTAGIGRLHVDLFVLSVVMLYLELLLIRWISSEIRIFAYFKNFTLIAAFLGIGLGCLVARRGQPGRGLPAGAPDLFPEAGDTDYLGHNLAYRLQPRADRVLVVGAGTGNDVAATHPSIRPAPLTA